MPALDAPVLPQGTISGRDQPVVALGDDLHLRPWGAPGDAATAMSAFAAPDIQRWHLRRLDTLEEADEWVAAWRQRWLNDTDASWAIADKATNAAVGYVALRGVFLHAASAEMSYWVIPPARGRGSAARAAAAVCDWGLDVLGLERVFVKHSVHNPASCRVAEQAGFVAEGTMRRAMRHADGWHNMHLHARVRSS